MIKASKLTKIYKLEEVETVALSETIGIENLKINRFDFCPNISYAILG